VTDVDDRALKRLFRTDAIPTEDDYAKLIDSIRNDIVWLSVRIGGFAQHFARLDRGQDSSLDAAQAAIGVLRKQVTKLEEDYAALELATRNHAAKVDPVLAKHDKAIADAGAESEAQSGRLTAATLDIKALAHRAATLETDASTLRDQAGKLVDVADTHASSLASQGKAIAAVRIDIGELQTALGEQRAQVWNLEKQLSELYAKLTAQPSLLLGAEALPGPPGESEWGDAPANGNRKTIEIGHFLLGQSSATGDRHEPGADNLLEVLAFFSAKDELEVVRPSFAVLRRDRDGRLVALPGRRRFLRGPWLWLLDLFGLLIVITCDGDKLTIRGRRFPWPSSGHRYRISYRVSGRQSPPGIGAPGPSSRPIPGGKKRSQ